jgi:hypothetical protein
VAYDPPILELKATYGLAAPEPFTAPALNPLWSKEVYAKMNSKMTPKPENVSMPCYKDVCEIYWSHIPSHYIELRMIILI